MAKYSRFDPRNKKKGRNKKNYLLRDTKIHNVDSSKNDNYMMEDNRNVYTRKSGTRV